MVIHYLLWLLIISLYLPVFYILYTKIWSIIDYGHAYFILPVFLWLIWQKRKQLRELSTHRTQKFRIYYLLIFLAGLSLFVFGWRFDIIAIYTFSLIPTLYGIIGYFYGTNIINTLTFPILYLIFLVPPPIPIIDSITLPLRQFVTVTTESILKFFDYPVEREGFILSIGYQEITIGTPCSGIRSLLTLFSLIFAYIYVKKGPLIKKAILVLFITPSALMGNLIRIITLCLITFYFGKQAGEGFLHNFSGIMVFIVALLFMLGIEAILDKTIFHKKKI